jgi:hypothetical protein
MDVPIDNAIVKSCFLLSVVATQFLTHVSVNFQKNPKIAKKHRKSKKIRFLIYLHRF